MQQQTHLPGFSASTLSFFRVARRTCRSSFWLNGRWPFGRLPPKRALNQPPLLPLLAARLLLLVAVLAAACCGRRRLLLAAVDAAADLDIAAAAVFIGRSTLRVPVACDGAVVVMRLSGLESGGRICRLNHC